MSDSRWRLIYYVLPSGRMPVAEFLATLEQTDPDAYWEFLDVHIPTLGLGGPAVGYPLFKRVADTQFSEIRWRGKHGANYRIYCSIESDRRLVCLHAVVKRWRLFRTDDRKICKDRYRDYHSGAYDHEARRRPPA